MAWNGCYFFLRSDWSQQPDTRRAASSLDGVITGELRGEVLLRPETGK